MDPKKINTPGGCIHKDYKTFKPTQPPKLEGGALPNKCGTLRLWCVAECLTVKLDAILTDKCMISPTGGRNNKKYKPNLTYHMPEIKVKDP